MPEIHKFLSLCALAPSQDRLAYELVRAIQQRGCEIQECRIAPLGDHVSAALLISGNWSAVGRLESALPGLAEQLGFELHWVHSAMSPISDDRRPYTAEIVAPQQSTTLVDLLGFFNEQGVRITDIHAQSYKSGLTGAEMCNIHLALQVPLNQHPQALREAFMDLCDELHADGMLDPIKS